MVRIKHRYLLANVLFPELPPSTTGKPAPSPSSTTLAFHAPLPSTLTPPVLLNLLRAQISHLFGDYGLGAASSSLKVTYFSQATSTVIIRCPRKVYRLVWAALTCLASLPVGGAAGARTGRSGGLVASGERDRRCVVRVVRVSGTIRKAEEEAVRRARQEIIRVKMLETNADGGALDKLLGFVGDGRSSGGKEDDVEEGIEDLSDDAEEGTEDLSDD